MMGTLPDLPAITDIFVQEISPGFPFELAAARFAGDPGTVVLLSGSDMDCARYNCLAVDPWLELTGYRDRMALEIRSADGTVTRTRITQNPFDLLNDLVARLTLSNFQTDLPCAAGLFGYFGYDLKDQIEALPRTCAETFLPDICLYLPSAVLTQDQRSGKTTLSVPVLDKDMARARTCAETFLARMDYPWEPSGFSIDFRGFTSSFSRDEYMDAVAKVIQYLRAGDIYQANLSQRFETGFSGDTYSLFLELFRRNPAAFFSYINAGNHQVVSTSPERFIQVADRAVETRPIKGTIARCADPDADKANGRKLSSSLKDDAELTMIVDLMRNDISRVTEAGSVEVVEHKRLEPYENVFHLVSVVKGTLQPDKTAVDLIRGTFPGGSITGCPKIRAMEIIDELEPVKRHVYTGSIGYISFHGTMDLSIAIRTATVFDGRLIFSVGGGIVYDSDPEKEFQETLDKGKTIMETLLSASSKPDTAPLKAWINGKLTDQDRSVVPAAGPAYEYGAGLFETLRVDRGRPVLLAEHIRRMERSWDQLFDLPLPDITWDRVIDQLVRENGLAGRTAAVKLIMAPDGRPGHRVYTAAYIRPYVHRLEVLGKSGLDLAVFPESRETFLADHKTMNYFFYERAGAWARKNGADEALILNPDRSVSETNTCSIFALEGNTLVIPQSTHVLPGVTLAAVTGALAGRGYKVKHEPLSVERLAALPNVMAANSLMGAVPVDRIGEIGILHDPALCPMINRLLEGAE
ncbi:MAG: aminodeoxychorismate synthase component I [Desulfobacter sp.]|nr:MAG: aminodeoxychorismate synthase component I [Desulfobacter sp.]